LFRVLTSRSPAPGTLPDSRTSAKMSASVVDPKYGMHTAWTGPRRWTE
jgi:hypothetical protein